MSDWSTDHGPIYVFNDEGVFLPWRTRFRTARRFLFWIMQLIKQAACLHTQRKFNSCGRMQPPPDEARKWISEYEWKTGSVIRVNFICIRCRKFSHVYMPDFELMGHKAYGIKKS